MRIITSGKPYLDIDVYAGIIAYAELLRAQGIAAHAVSTSILNESIPPQLLELKVDFLTELPPAPEHQFVILDTSDPKHFDNVVQLEQVSEVLDHHPGLEHYWASQPGVKTRIELFGAVCTIVYEQWERAGLFANMSRESAALLADGILDNTLNFGAHVSTAADERAYQSLARKAGLADSWPQEYFQSCEKSMLKDIPTAVTNDLKILDFKSSPDSPVCVGQLVVWDADALLKSSAPAIKSTLSHQQSHWFMNLISLRHRANRLYTSDETTQAWLTDLLGAHFQNAVATTDRPWLRKEIMQCDLNFAKTKTSDS